MTKAGCESVSTGRSDMQCNYNKFKLIKDLKDKPNKLPLNNIIPIIRRLFLINIIHPIISSININIITEFIPYL